MKTTIELPDTVFRHAKAVAATQGVTLRQYFTEALQAQLRRSTGEDRRHSDEPPWMAGFGELADLGEENRRILGLIEEEFERLSPGSMPIRF